MPFTFSHPAIVLPLTFLNKKWYSLTGLVVGSMVPDFEYFIRMKVQSQYSHTISGIFYFDLPLGLLLAFLYHNIVRGKLLENLPHMLACRLTVYRTFNWNQYFRLNFPIVIISILVGTASHLLWDSFTHVSGYFVYLAPVLRDTVIIMKHSVPIFKILQHLSTLIGALSIVFAILLLPTTNCSSSLIKYRYWIAVLSVAALVLAVRQPVSLGDAVVCVISSLLVGIIAAPLILTCITRSEIPV